MVKNKLIRFFKKKTNYVQLFTIVVNTVRVRRDRTNTRVKCLFR